MNPFNPSSLPDDAEGDVYRSAGRRMSDAPHIKFWDYVKVALQIGVLVWSAAMLSAKVSQLAINVSELTIVTAKLQSTVEDVRVDNARIDIRLDNLEKKNP